MNRRDVVAERFEAMFGYTLEEGERRLRVLLSRAINMDRFTGDFDPAAFTASKVSMSERDFALIAFFCLAGVGALAELGVDVEELHPMIVIERTPRLGKGEIALCPGLRRRTQGGPDVFESMGGDHEWKAGSVGTDMCIRCGVYRPTPVSDESA